MTEDAFMVRFSSLLEFCDVYRTDVRDGFINVPVEGEFSAGAPCTAVLAIPVFEEEIPVRAEVADIADGELVLKLDETDEAYERLGWLFDLCGRVIEDLLESGRFKILGRAPAAGAVAEHDEYYDEAPGAPPTPSPMMGAPVSDVSGTTADAWVPPGQEPLSSGGVTPEALREAMMDAYRRRTTGVLRVDHQLGTTVVFLDKGGPVQLRDDPVVVDECLGVLLTRAGRIDESQFKKSLEIMNETGKLQGECLIDMGLLTFPVLVMALMKQTEIKTLRLLDVTEGQFALYEVDRHRQKFIAPPLKVPGLLYKRLKTHYGEARIDDLIMAQRPYLDQYSEVVVDFPIDDMQLKKSEVEFLDILGRRSYRMREIYTVSNFGRADTSKNIMAFMAMNILRFKDEEDLSQIIDNFRVKLDTKLKNMEDQNLFEKLELHWSARDDDVEDGHKRLIEEWNKLGKGYDLPAELEKMRADILAEIEDAYNRIRIPQARREYRSTVYEEQQIWVSADVFFKQAEMLMIKKDWQKVYDNVSRAAELQPENRKYAQTLAKCKTEMRKGSD